MINRKEPLIVAIGSYIEHLINTKIVYTVQKKKEQ